MFYHRYALEIVFPLWSLGLSIPGNINMLPEKLKKSPLRESFSGSILLSRAGTDKPTRPDLTAGAREMLLSVSFGHLPLSRRAKALLLGPQASKCLLLTPSRPYGLGEGEIYY